MKTNFLTLLLFGILIFLVLTNLHSVSALTVSSVSTSPSEVEPGKTVDITIRLENDGNEDIEDVSVSLIFRELIKDSFGNVVSVNEVPFAPFDSSSEVSFDEIREDKSKEAEFEIIALSDAKSGVYKIPLQITYTENSQTKTKSSLISITVNSKPIIDVQPADSLLIKGQEGKIDVKIVNKGLSDIKFLEVEIGNSGVFSLTSSNKVYIGDLDSNDFDTAEFKAFFKETSPTNLNVPVKIIYKDTFNKEYTEDYTLPLRVYTKEQAIQLGLLKKSNTTTYIIVVIVLIIIYIVYRKIKKRRKLRKAREVKGG